MDTWYANTYRKLFGSQKWGWLPHVQPQEGCSRDQHDYAVKLHAAKPPGYLSEGTGTCWKPHFQEGDNQKNSANFNNWHWTSMGAMFWDFVTLYINDKSWISCPEPGKYGEHFVHSLWSLEPSSCILTMILDETASPMGWLSGEDLRWTLNGHV